MQLLRTTRAACQRIALVDGADGFEPAELPPDALRHLVWIRAHDIAEVFAAADVVTRDGNYAVVVLDLRGLHEREVLKTPASLWHRLRCAVDDSPTAVLVQTTLPVVPAVTWRLNLTVSLALTQRRMERPTLANSIQIEVVRGHIEIEERSA